MVSGTDTININLHLDEQLKKALGNSEGNAQNQSQISRMSGLSPGQLSAEMKVMESINKQMEKKLPPLEAFFKKIGIEVGIKSLLKQSQIFTSTIGSLFQMFGAMIDVMLAPFTKYIVIAITKFAEWIPKIGRVMEWIERNIFARVIGFIQNADNWLENKLGIGGLANTPAIAGTVATVLYLLSSKFRWLVNSIYNKLIGPWLSKMPLVPKTLRWGGGLGTPPKAGQYDELLDVLRKAGMVEDMPTGAKATAWLDEASKLIAEWQLRLGTQNKNIILESGQIVSDVGDDASKLRLLTSQMTTDTLEQLRLLVAADTGMPDIMRKAINEMLGEVKGIDFVGETGGSLLRAKLAKIGDIFSAWLGVKGGLYVKITTGIAAIGAAVWAILAFRPPAGGIPATAESILKSVLDAEGGIKTAATAASEIPAGAAPAVKNALKTLTAAGLDTAADALSADYLRQKALYESQFTEGQVGKTQLGGVKSYKDLSRELTLGMVDDVSYKSLVRHLETVTNEEGFRVGHSMLKDVQAWKTSGDPSKMKDLRDLLQSWRLGQLGEVGNALPVGPTRSVVDWMGSAGKRQWMNQLSNVRSSVFDMPGAKNLPAKMFGMTELQKAFSVATKQPGFIKRFGRMVRGMVPGIGLGISAWYAEQSPSEGNLPEWDLLPEHVQKQLEDLRMLSHVIGDPLGAGGLLPSLTGDVIQQFMRMDANKIASDALMQLYIESGGAEGHPLGMPSSEGTLFEIMPPWRRQLMEDNIARSIYLPPEGGDGFFNWLKGQFIGLFNPLGASPVVNPSGYFGPAAAGAMGNEVPWNMGSFPEHFETRATYDAYMKQHYTSVTVTINGQQVTRQAFTGQQHMAYYEHLEQITTPEYGNIQVKVIEEEKNDNNSLVDSTNELRNRNSFRSYSPEQ